MRVFRFLGFAWVVLTALVAAARGGGESGAAGLKASQTVLLVNEKDEDGEYTDIGAYYFKLSLSRYASHSIWINPGGNEDLSLEVYTNDEDAMADFEVDTSSDGVLYARIGGEDWDAEDPSSVTFYVYVTGNVGDRVTVSSSSSYMNFEPKGSEENVVNITFDENGKKLSTRFVEDEYWMSSYLKAGRLYRVRSTGGTSENPIAFEIEGKTVSDDEEDGEDVEGTERTEDDVEDFIVFGDPRHASDTNNVAMVFSPSASRSYTFMLSGGTNANFTLEYQLLKLRSPADHRPATLDASNGFQATFVPGRQVANWDYGDLVIDDNLFSVSMTKGQRYAFETSGGATNLLIAVYDAKGNILAENTSLDGTSFDVRVVVEAPSSGVFYVGVCNSDLAPYAEVTGGEVTLSVVSAVAQDGTPDEWDSSDDTVAGASGLEVVPASAGSLPDVEGSVHGPHRFSRTDWTDTFVVAARKGVVYRVGVEFANPDETSVLPLNVEVFTLSGTREVLFTSKEIMPGGDAHVEFMATMNVACYIRMSVADGRGLDYPAYNVRAVGYSQSGVALGVLTVNTPGAPSATWSLGSETVKYPSGSSVLVSGANTVKLSSVTGYKAAVAVTNVTVVAGAAPTVVNIVYSDTFDPKDNAAGGATALTLKNVDADYARRTLWCDDPGDNFAFAGTDGHYYDLALKNVEGDGVSFSITNAEMGVMAENVSSVRQLVLPKTRSKYILTVKNGEGATAFGGYTLSGKFANVGAIKFVKTAVKVKEDAANAVVTVNRTAKDGYVRVRYGTVAGTATPGEDYVAQNGILEWANGDNKAKTISVKLIPDLVPVYEGDKTFTVRLEPVGASELSEVEYPASIVGGDCTVTLVETSKTGATIADAYAKKTPKVVTVKTEAVPLETGTFYGVLSEDGSALTNGLPALASVTFTASTASPSALSAKVSLAGKTYNFSAKGWDDDPEAGVRRKEFFLAQKVNRLDEETGRTVSATVTNTLAVTLNVGATETAGDWLRAGGVAELIMNLPDVSNRGYQEEIRYAGELRRNNVKVQDYLTAVTNFTGYYTVALVPFGGGCADGIPAGNGYLTLTVDNKGTVKVAGMLADGKTKLSLSAAACALMADASSANGYSLYVPLHSAKSPNCFGGVLRLFADKSGKVVVDSTCELTWNNDDAKLTYYGEEGWRIVVSPVGGWYDTVLNLQRHYLTRSFEVDVAESDEFPAELVAADFGMVTDVQPHGTPIDLVGDVFSTAKKSLVKAGKLYDLAGSVNPCNVQVKLARATGLVSGSFSLWSGSEDGTKQAELTGIKHYGVLLLARDEFFSPLDNEVVSAGFCCKAVKVVNVNEDTGRKTTRNWTFSLPFNIIGIDLGEPDWWADDWGTALDGSEDEG